MVRYPFSPSSRQYFEKLPIEESFSSRTVLLQAEDRLLDCLGKLTSLKKIRYERHIEDDVEFTSFFVAALVASQDTNLALMFSAKEANKAKELFMKEKIGDKPVIMQQCYGFRLLYTNEDRSDYPFLATVEDYLAYIVKYELNKSDRWKLVNQTLSNGMVYLSNNSVNDLFRDLAQRLIYEGATKLRRGAFPKQLVEIREKMVPFLPLPKIRSGRGYLYIEELLKHPVSDGRHRMVWLVLSGYLINVKKLEPARAIEIIRDYVAAAGETREMRRFVEYNVRRAQRNGLLPPTLNKLKTDHPDLYTLLPKEITAKYSTSSARP